MTRYAVIFFALFLPFLAPAQGGDQQLRAKADQLFNEQRFAEAMPMYSQLVSLTPGDRELNYRLGACMLAGSADKEQAISHLRFATDAPNTDPLAWYWLGRAYHLNYRFKEAQTAYQRFLGTADKKNLEAWPVEALQRQCRNGERLLSSLKEITVRNKVEVADADFFRFYDLADIGGKIVVLPEELMTSTDKKRKLRSLVYLPDKPGPFYFSSYGRDGATGRDIYRTQLLPDGTFATPVKLAGYINTDQDEDYPFMHPDGKTFYFSSKGHNSMGGYDVFKASYDRGLDAFGRPENMDFAVNTPDDDIFYIVDGEQKEACFASGRNSKQGNLHVYRVATAQLPVLISVFKGTYASSIDPEDRKAHVIVEDMLTQERVADVRTDINGNYVLSVPRAGRYRYLVTCGPTGTTHGGVVEVPKADGPRAYRQELVLDRKGDLEQLTIRNYFDEPLGDDLITLALDEIKRRARLDVSDHEPLVQQEVAQQQPTGDVMTRAGFTGDIDKAQAVKLAQDDAKELEAQAAEEEALSGEAFALALDATNEAERAAAKSDDLIKQAGAATDEGERNELMVEAARERQRSREASMRARAAYNTGQALNAATISTKQKATTAAKLSTDLASTSASGNDEATLPLLRTLKQRMDEKARPDMSQEPAEQARKLLTEQEKESARLLSMARSKREEENELTDRVARLKREKDETRSRSRKEEIDRELGTLEPQLAALRQETVAAFNKAAGAERQTAVARGQASLTRHLAQSNDHHPGADLTADEAQQLGLRISGTDQRIAALAIDERYDAQITADAAQAEARLFDWGTASTADAVSTDRSATRSMDRNTAGDATVAASRTAGIAQPEVEDAALRSATIAHKPDQRGTEEEPTGSETMALESNRQADAGTERTNGSVVTDQRSAAGEATAQRVQSSGQDASRGLQPIGSGDATPLADQRTAVAEELKSRDRFVLENERAELAQLASAERDRTKREDLQARMGAIDAELNRRDTESNLSERTQSNTEEESAIEVDMSRPVAVFTPDAKDESIIAQVYASYDDDRKAAERLPDADARADAINGIESMLADSLRGEMQRQVAILKLSPQQAETVLPRVDRLRRMRDDHLAAGERAVTERQAELALTQEQTETMSTGSLAASADGNDPINDRFIQIDRLATDVYASRVEHRSHAKGMDEAVAFREADVARMEGLTTRIDSMEQQLLSMPIGKESDKLRRKVDQMIDERFIIRTDLGQRSAFLMKEEWRTANDSLKTVEAKSASRGLAPDEPLLQMADAAKAEAKRYFDDAAQLRKRADRIEDIVARDSLYRRAYRNELLALQQMDRAITVRSYLAGDQHRRGEQLTYEVVAARVLGLDRTELMAASPAGSIARTEGSNGSRGARPDSTAASVPEAPDRIIQESARVVSPATALGSSAAQQDASAQSRSEQAGQSGDSPGGDAAAAQGDTRSMQSSRVADVTVGTRSGDADAFANEVIQRSERQLDAQDRVPAQLYERFLGSEPTMVAPTALEPGNDPDLLALRLERSQQSAADLEKRSAEASDRALALADSAAKARKRDRDELEAMSVRERALSDSLHRASVYELGQAREAEQLRDEAQVAKGLRERLVKFYYLTAEEQRMVMLEGDASRYFQARARAMEQLAVAGEAAESARSNREVSALLRDQARAAEHDAAAGRLPANEAVGRASLLDARAAVLEQKADSLDRVSARLRGAAEINESQASAMLQGMTPERSSELMAMEQRTRRTESLLAESRDQAGQQADLAPITLNRPARASEATRGTEQPLAQAEPAATSRASERPATTERVTAARPFRMPEELVEDFFELKAAAAPREEPIPLDAPMPGGIVFKVQIGAFRKAIPQQAFSDMTPVMGETVGNGLVRYTAGLFTGFGQAAAAKDLVRERGYRDAFVVAYRDGQRIPLGEAMRAAQAATAAQAQHTAPAGEAPQRVIDPVSTSNQQPVTATIARPAVAPVPVAAQEDATAILARYPETADAIVAAFEPKPEATAYYNVPGAAPARQVELVKGLFFTVQVGVYSRPVPLDKLFNITPLNSELTETAKVRYTTGFYTDTDQARTRKDEAVVLGVKDAFVTAYLNGRRIPVREAQALLEKFGPSILAKP